MKEGLLCVIAKFLGASTFVLALTGKTERSILGHWPLVHEKLVAKVQKLSTVNLSYKYVAMAYIALVMLVRSKLTMWSIDSVAWVVATAAGLYSLPFQTAIFQATNPHAR